MYLLILFIITVNSVLVPYPLNHKNFHTKSSIKTHSLKSDRIPKSKFHHFYNPEPFNQKVQVRSISIPDYELTPVEFKNAKKPVVNIPEVKLRQMMWFKFILHQPTSSQIYNYISQYLQANLYDYACNKYGKEKGHEAFHILTGIHKDYVVLIVDPGLVQRIDSFKKFLSYRSFGNVILPWKARDLFSDYLGYQTTYHVMALTKSQLSKVLNVGIHSNAFLHRAVQEYHSSKIDEETMNLSLEKSYYLNRISDSNLNDKYDILISISDYPDVELFKFFSKNKNSLYMEKDAELRLFEIRIPILDTISFTIIQSDEMNNFGIENSEKQLEVENFALWTISANQISSVFTLENMMKNE